MKKNRLNRLYVISFAIPFFTMLVIFIGNKIFPFGDRSFLHIDMYHQYFPFLTEFFHKLRSGDSLLYSWNTGIGSNFIALYAYYLASPINWLAFLCPEKYLMEFMSYLVVLKIGLCGFSCSYYLSKHFNTNRLSISFFACFYAMSGYLAAYNWNVMWLDCIVLAPLIILGLEMLVNEGKYKLYCISLAVAILSNYYICIMICIYLVLYFLIVLLPLAEKKLRACLQFCVFSLLAGGMGAVLLLPELAALQLSKFSAADFPSTVKTYFSIFDILARHCMDVAVETGLDHWPNIYCSVAVLFLFPLYITCKNIPIRKKIGNLVLLAVLLISFSANTLTFLWHGFNYPDSLPCRQSFLYILLLLTVCFEAFLHVRESSKTEISCVFFGVLIFLVLCQKLITDDAFTYRTYLLSAAFLIMYAILLHKYRDHTVTPKLLTFFTALIIILESGSNMLLTSVPTVSRTNYLKNYETYHVLYEKQANTESDKFYRYEKDTRVTNNDGMLQSYPSASLFSSTTNGLVNAFYNRYGLKNSKVFYSYEGATPFTGALLSAKYFYSKEEKESDSLYTLVNEMNGIYLYENTYTIPLGFMINPNGEDAETLIEDQNTAFGVINEDRAIDTDEGEEVDLEEEWEEMLNPVERQNLLAKRLGATGDLFEEIPSSSTDSGAVIDVPYDGHIYAYCNTKKIKTLNAYSQNSDLTFKKMNNKRILDLGYQDAGSSVMLEAKEDYPLNMTAYILHENVLAELISQLNTQTMSIDSLSSSRMTGRVMAQEDGYLILSIPYDPGFTITVDGVKTQASLFEEMMIAIPITQGSHTVTLSYYPEGLNAGIVLSLISLIAFLLIVFYPKYSKKLRFK